MYYYSARVCESSNFLQSPELNKVFIFYEVLYLAKFIFYEVLYLVEFLSSTKSCVL